MKPSLFQFGFPSGATASCLSTYAMNGLDKFYLNCEKGFAEMQPSTGYGPIKKPAIKGKSYTNISPIRPSKWMKCLTLFCGEKNQSFL